MIRFFEESGALVVRLRNETLRIEGWGRNALRVRATLLKKCPSMLMPLPKRWSIAQR